jgi:hypothetical protein
MLLPLQEIQVGRTRTVLQISEYILLICTGINIMDFLAKISSFAD